ncbi:hypothetical protein AAFF_G00257270 [Aldrovandia affinis]|uniref:Uncharacterized protein n=1 Tax=Aldrovandia affinis TaxID=143900 RepID=A0AAD7WTC6_9TELE|nr:hypothetical protein AAFF_G00257270 [Aldrovandia affinis]
MTDNLQSHEDPSANSEQQRDMLNVQMCAKLQYYHKPAIRHYCSGITTSMYVNMCHAIYPSGKKVINSLVAWSRSQNSLDSRCLAQRQEAVWENPR